MFGWGSLKNIFYLRDFKRRRVSSYDREGGNKDFLIIAPGEKRIIFDVEGPGCITHIWTTQSGMNAPHLVRNIIIRIWWDDEKDPSVECPLGDFFGLGHGERINFHSLPLQMSPQKGKGFNCWWPMPFKKHARIEIENDNPKSWIPDPEHIFHKKPGIAFYYYVDYEIYDKWPENPPYPIGYFHCLFHKVDYEKDQWRDRDTGKKFSVLEWQILGGKNTRENGGYEKNHVILYAEGKGQYVGCHIDIYNRFRWKVPLSLNWPGEGDDMIFIDEDVGKEPTLYGTGTEDYVNTAYCPTQKYDGLYHGVIKGNWNPWGRLSYYRYHILDPVSFNKKIKVTIEHGHDNHRGDIWETTAYWYQLEPHLKFPPFPTREERSPKPKRRNKKRKIWMLLLLFIIIGMSYYFLL